MFHTGFHLIKPSIDELIQIRSLLNNTISNYLECIEEVNRDVLEHDEYMDKAIKGELQVVDDRRLKPGYVYVAKCITTGYYKIGFSKNPKNRIKQLKTANPTIELIFYNDVIDYSVEYMIHDKMKSKRIEGEWFKLSQMDLNDIYEETKSDVPF